MATIIYVEFRSATGTIYVREPCGSMKEARRTMIEILQDLDPLVGLDDGDNFRIVVESNAEQ